MIERATVADLEGVAACASVFASSSRFLRRFDSAVFVRTWTSLLEADLGVIFVLRSAGEVSGILGGVAYPDALNGALVATEFFWFVRPDSRGGGLRLYREFEEWARECGCAQIRMAHMLDSMPEKLDRVYRRLGFQPVEVHYEKEL